MKQCRVILSLAVLVAVLFASAAFVYAIDFEAEEKYESVFIIQSGNSLGSGFAVGSNCIVTNAHVIQHPQRVSVLTYGGTEQKAQVIGMDEDQDIAVLVVEEGNYPVLTIAKDIQIGEDVFAIGAPKSMAYTLTKGVISAKEREMGAYTYVQTDAPINEGNSGGPLLNASGEVVGMNTMKMLDSEGIGLAIPMSRICAYLTELGVELDEGGNVPQPIAPEELPEETGSAPIPQETEEAEEGSNRRRTTVSRAALAAWAVAVASMLLNVVLVILLVQKKQRTAPVKQDPSERTDFEIDILG